VELGKYVKWRSEKFGAVIFDTLSEKVYVTNEVGKDILCLFAEGLDTAASVARLREEYDGDEAQIASDVAAFEHELQERELIVPITEGKA
jgi:hypothetical protein